MLTEMKSPSGGLSDTAKGRPPVTVAPAGDGAVGPNRAGVAVDAHRDEFALGRRGLPVITVAPAGDGGVGPYPAGVVVPGADGDEFALGRRGLAVIIVAPAGDGGVGPSLRRCGRTRR